MTEPSLPNESEDTWADEFAQALQAHRRRMQDFLAAFRERESRIQAVVEQFLAQYANQPVAIPSEAATPADSAELAGLRSEREQLLEKLAETEKRLTEMTQRVESLEDQLASASQAATATSDSEDYRRRYEMAVQDLRELKARNQQLEQQVQASQHVGPSGPTLDWEAEKRRILAALEAEEQGEPTTEADANRRMEIEQIVRKTEQILADKDREIAELKQLLQDQSANLGSVAVGAAALGSVLDSDAIIREERENLRRLQKEWEEKLRQAEVELSLERAKLARQRAELEEKLNALANQHTPTAAAPQAPASSDKPSRGRWLSRLGLKDPNADS